MTIVWVRLVPNSKKHSWHAYRDRATTYCGRVIPPEADRQDALPAGKSCESCLRIIGRTADAA